MDTPNSRNTAQVPEEPTAASILGIKGQLRFRPHGSTQKAHVVLRQVDWSPEDSDDEADPSMVYFSLFAQKRIEVKPGKEILLAVATPDGTFLDTPVIFAGKLTEESVDINGAAFSSSGQDSLSALQSSILPPKMRKTWSKRISIPAPIHSAPSRHYVSVATQVEQFSTPEEEEDSSHRDRSLSPMELDSAPSSPLSPSSASLLEVNGLPQVTAKSASFSPPGLGLSVSPQLQPVAGQANVAPTTLSSDHSSHSKPPIIARTEEAQFASPTYSTPTATKEETATADLSPSGTENTLPSYSAATDTIVPLRVSIPPSPAGDVPTLVTTHPTAATSTAAPYVPKRKTVPNPFVSGGLLTDFVSSSAAKKSDDSRHAQTEENGSASPDEIPGLSQLVPKMEYVPITKPSTPVTFEKDDGSDSASSLSISPPSVSPTSPRRSPSYVSSPSPSSSKVRVEDTLPPPPPPLQPQQNESSLAYDPARPDLQLNRKVSLFPPPLAMPNFPPNLVRPQSSAPPPPPPPLARWQNGHIPPPPLPSTTTRRTSTPPLQPLPYIPTNSYSNPLGIRPAAPSGTWKHDRYNPNDQVHSTLTPTATVAKKPVPIGSGWPRNRNVNGQTSKSGSKWSATKSTAFVAASNPPSAPPIPPYSPADVISSVSAANTSLTPSPATQQNVQASDTPESSYTPALPTPNGAPIPIPIPSLNTLETSPGIVIPTSAPTTSIAAPAVISRPPSNAVLTTAHPLPVKPPAFAGDPGAWSPSMGVKRMGSPGLQSQSPDPRRARSFNWPISEPLYTLRIRGDADAGILAIAHSSDGALCAVTCTDKIVRIVSAKARTELANLAHVMPVLTVVWMERDAGVITLGDNGIVSTWTRIANNKWKWSKIFDASAGRSDDKPGCLAYGGDRIAVSYPNTGVKVWLFIKGTWQPQRSILRQNVTTLQFVEEGEALIGGTTDGVLWYCQVPNGTLRAYSFMKSKVYTLDVDPRGDHVLAAQTGGKSHLVNISQDDQKGKTEQVYSLKDPDQEPGANYDFGALFASRGQRILFGDVRGCIMVWDRTKGDIVHGLNHGEDKTIQAVSCFDGAQAGDGHILTGSRQGHLTWFSQPPS